MLRAFVLGCLLCASGCALEELDLEGRDCPCVDGWVCDTARNVCVEELVDDDAGPGGMDAGPPGMDAGEPLDDAGSPPTDAGEPPEDAGTDAGGVDAGTIGPPSRCVAGDLGDRLFCESFESGDEGSFTGSLTDATGSGFAYVNDPVYRGNYAMRATAARLGRFAVLTASPFDPATTTDIYFRAYYYFPSTTETAMETHYLGNDAHNQWISVTFSPSRVVNFHTHDFPTSGRADVDAARSLDTWHCVELHMHVDETEGSIELFFNGTSLGSATMVNTRTDPPSTIFGVGVAWKSAGSDERFVYVDEVVADTSPIGCD